MGGVAICFPSGTTCAFRPVHCKKTDLTFMMIGDHKSSSSSINIFVSYNNSCCLVVVLFAGKDVQMVAFCCHQPPDLTSVVALWLGLPLYGEAKPARCHATEIRTWCERSARLVVAACCSARQQPSRGLSATTESITKLNRKTDKNNKSRCHQHP